MKLLKVRSPYNQEIISEIFMDSKESFETKVNKAQNTFRDQPNALKLFERITILKKSIRIIEEQKEELALQISKEGGKPLKDARIEMDRAIQGIDHCISLLHLIKGEEISMGLNQSSSSHLAFTRREPLGVVLAISAFNHPFNLLIHQIIPAFLVGNMVLIKPALETPLSCLSLLQILKDSGLPEGYIQSLIIDHDLTERLVSDERINFLSFIGSAPVGWKLRSLLAPGVDCSLEHGGVAPAIIEADADLNETILPLIRSSFYHAGQVCVSTQRIFIHEHIFKEFQEHFCKATQKLITGDPCLENTDVGPLIRKKEIERITQWIQDSKAHGGSVILGGNRLTETCFTPTVLVNPSLSSQVSQEEIFGPVVCLYTYKNTQEAIDNANNTAFAFQASVFTKNLDKALEIAQKLNAATVLINEQTAFRMDWMPFGGIKASGLKKGGFYNTMLDLTKEKLYVLKSPVLRNL